jgi:hypothetical protein
MVEVVSSISGHVYDLASEKVDAEDLAMNHHFRKGCHSHKH